MSESDKQKEDQVGWKIPAFVFSLVIILWGATWYFLRNDPGRGSFGDMFGAVNALFSGLAFAGVIYTLLLQRKELKLQRRELEETRKELKGQKEQLEAQNQTLKKQNFESTFFQLLRLQNEIVNSIDLVNPNDNTRVTRGRDCFRVFYKRLHKQWDKANSELQGKPDSEKINVAYSAFFLEAQAEIGHYFRSLYNIVKFVDRSEVVEKNLYTNLVCAQLSSYELALLFYNCLSDIGKEKFKPLVEKYSLLKTLPKQMLFNPPDHLPLYKGGVIGE
jgi:hypothetical protein